MKHILLLTVLISLTAELLSQTKESDLKYFLTESNEKSYLAAPAFGNVEPTVFETSVCVGKYFQTANSKITFEPRFKVVMRMLNKPSCPINTPSYLPSLSLHKLFRSESDSSALFSSVMFGHHSNGQDDPFYSENGEVNFKSGNFSTNYVKVSITKRKVSGAYLSAGIEKHVNIDRCDELDDNYGYLRALFDFKSRDGDLSRLIKKIKQNNFVQISLNSAWIFGKISGVKRVNADKRLITSLVLTYKPAAVKGVSVFLQFFRGQDYYNINFSKHLSFSRIGLSIDLEK